MTRKPRTNLTKSKIILLYRQYRAILILTNNLSATERGKIDRSLDRLPQMEIEEIRKKLPKIQELTRKLFNVYGVIGTLDEFELLSAVSKREKGSSHINYVAKSYIERVFAHYEHVIPIFSELPPHARIGIPYGIEIKGEIEVFILEVSLFEDMAALWNTSLELSNSLKLEYSKERKKQMNALLRATTKAVFNFIEGYLNSLALDILTTQAVSPKDEILLTEWDETKKRPVFLTLRDKLLKYPKIAIGALEPPLSESNCPELVQIVAFEKELRHPLTHPNPQISPKDKSFDREQMYMNIEITEVAQICDLTIELIHKIDKVMNHQYGGVNNWLIKRENTGYFPEKVFT